MATPEGDLRTPKSELRNPSLTYRGMLWLWSGPLVLLALAVALGVIPSPVVPLLPVLFLLLLAEVAVILALRRLAPLAPLADRAVDYAWTLMVPRLAERGFVMAEVDFLAGLSLISTEHGSPAARREMLEVALRFAVTEAMLGRSVGLLASLRRLAVHDAGQGRKDPVPMVVDDIARCLEGKLPLAY